MAEKDDSNDKKKKKSIIASLDLKNYKAKYTDSYGLGKPNDIDIDNFLIAEPGSKKDESKNEISEPVEEKIITPVENTVKVNRPTDTSVESNVQKDNIVTEQKPKKPDINSSVVDITKVDKKNNIPAQNIKSTIKKDNENIKEIVNTNDDFDKRVSAEAENDFYDEKPSQIDNGAFRSNIVAKNTSNEKIEKPLIETNKKGNRKINLREPVKVNVRHEIKDSKERIEETPPIHGEVEKKPQRRTETYGIIISAIALIYSIYTADRPLLFLSASLVLFLTRSIIAAPFGQHKQSIQNAIKSFSIVLFFGAIFFIFF